MSTNTPSTTALFSEMGLVPGMATRLLSLGLVQLVGDVLNPPLPTRRRTRITAEPRRTLLFVSQRWAHHTRTKASEPGLQPVSARTRPLRRQACVTLASGATVAGGVLSLGNEVPGCGRRRRTGLSLEGLGDREVPRPALVGEHQALHEDRVAQRIEIDEGVVMLRPAAMDDPGEGDLARLVVDLDNDVAPVCLERNLVGWPRAELPDPVGPFLEGGVVGAGSIEDDRRKGGEAG